MIFPSILSTNFAHLPDTLQQLETASIKAVHFDVMDNHFVPNLTFGDQFVRNLRQTSALIFDVHLMINNPLLNLPQYITTGAQMISCHYEAFLAPEEIIQATNLCRKNNIQFGLAIKPNTSVQVLEKYLSEVDFILIMSVEPGFGGQEFLPQTFIKLNELKELCNKKNIFPKIQVDGGINKSNMMKLKEHSVAYLVIGSAFFKESDYRNILFEYNEE